MPPRGDSEYRRINNPEYRLHYVGDVGALLVSYDKVCRAWNVPSREEPLAKRLKDHQYDQGGKEPKKDGASGPPLIRLDLSGINIPPGHLNALVCAIMGRGPELKVGVCELVATRCSCCGTHQRFVHARERCTTVYPCRSHMLHLNARYTAPRAR